MIDKDVAFTFSTRDDIWIMRVYHDGKIIFNIDKISDANPDDLAKWFVDAVHEICWGNGTIKGFVE